MHSIFHSSNRGMQSATCGVCTHSAECDFHLISHSFGVMECKSGEIRPHHQVLSLLYLVYNKLPVHRFPAEKVAAHYRRYRIYVCTEVMLRRC